MKITMQDLLEAGVHFGHRTQKWNPKMRKYIFGEKAGIHIIDLEQTAHALNRALAFIKQIASEGKTVLFVSTKSQTSLLLPEKANACKMPYISTRWLGGFLTNFSTIKRRIKYFRELEESHGSGELLKRYTKKEILLLERELAKLEKFFSGVKELSQTPDVLFIVDPIRDHLALKEAHALHIPIVALVDTNADPDLIDYPIPANDDAIKSLELIVGLLSQVISSYYQKPTPKVAPPVAPRVSEKPKASPASKPGETPKAATSPTPKPATKPVQKTTSSSTKKPKKPLTKTAK